jgi:hypothetical protein
MLAVAIPVTAITRGGEMDQGEHPYVGLMVAYSADLIDDMDGDGEPDTPDLDGDGLPDMVHDPVWRCSGALISANVFVTAGHCTEPDGSDWGDEPMLAAIWFDEDVDGGTPGNGYPYYELAPYTGTRNTHPLYNPGAFFLYDLGVVVLDADGAPMDSYAALPEAGAIDGMGKGRENSVVEAVGYGLQKINPVMVQADRVRMKADLMIVNTKGVAGIGNLPDSNSMMVSGDAKHGGTCFGDSGGPIFLGTDSNVIGAVTSFGLNGNCAGVGGVFRIDRQLELDWINGFGG